MAWQSLPVHYFTKSPAHWWSLTSESLWRGHHKCKNSDKGQTCSNTDIPDLGHLYQNGTLNSYWVAAWFTPVTTQIIPTTVPASPISGLFHPIKLQGALQKKIDRPTASSPAVETLPFTTRSSSCPTCVRLFSIFGTSFWMPFTALVTKCEVFEPPLGLLQASPSHTVCCRRLWLRLTLVMF